MERVIISIIATLALLTANVSFAKMLKLQSKKANASWNLSVNNQSPDQIKVDPKSAAKGFPKNVASGKVSTGSIKQPSDGSHYIVTYKNRNNSGCRFYFDTTKYEGITTVSSQSTRGYSKCNVLQKGGAIHLSVNAPGIQQ